MVNTKLCEQVLREVFSSPKLRDGKRGWKKRNKLARSTASLGDGTEGGNDSRGESEEPEESNRLSPMRPVLRGTQSLTTPSMRDLVEGQVIEGLGEGEEITPKRSASTGAAGRAREESVGEDGIFMMDDMTEEMTTLSRSLSYPNTLDRSTSPTTLPSSVIINSSTRLQGPVVISTSPTSSVAARPAFQSIIDFDLASLALLVSDVTLSLHEHFILVQHLTCNFTSPCYLHFKFRMCHSGITATPLP